MLPGTTEEAEASSGSSGYVAGVRRSRGSGSAGIATRCNQTLIVTKLWISDYGYDAGTHRLRRLPAPARRRPRRPLPAPPPGAERLRRHRRRIQGDRDRCWPTAAPARSASPTSCDDHLDEPDRRIDVVPAVNQVEVHPYFTPAAAARLHAEHGIVTQAWSPIGGITSTAPASDAVQQPARATRRSPRSRRSTARRPHRSCCAGTSSRASRRSRSRSSRPHRRELRRLRLRAHRRRGRRHRRPRHRHPRRPRPRVINTDLYPYKVENDQCPPGRATSSHDRRGGGAEARLRCDATARWAGR